MQKTGMEGKWRNIIAFSGSKPWGGFRSYSSKGMTQALPTWEVGKLGPKKWKQVLRKNKELPRKENNGAINFLLFFFFLITEGAIKHYNP